MEWPQLIGIASTAIVGVQGMLKVYQRVRFLMRPMKPPEEPKGLTIMNGEADRLFATLGRIEQKGDQTARRLELLSHRVASIEGRMSI